MVAKWLHVALPEKVKQKSEIDKLITELPKSSLKEFTLQPECWAVDKRIVDLNFPHDAFIIMIKRNGSYIRPGGSTLIEANDTLMVLADRMNDFEKVYNCLHKPPIA